MSDFYKESNNESTQELFNKSVIYKSELLRFSQDYSNVVDFNFAEKYLYGRVDRDFVSIQLNEKLVSFKQIKNSSDLDNVKVLNFVADGFQELSRQFVKAAQIGKIRTGDPYLTNLKAYAGYQNPDFAYSNYVTSFISAVKTKIKKDQIGFHSFDDFSVYFVDYVSSVAATFPFTKTAFVKSRFNDYLTNGLSLEVSDLSFTNDDQKIETFVNSPNFEYYLNACNSFGFMVDAASPWKITLDIGSQDVVDGLMKKYGYNSTDALLLVGYKKVHFSYYRLFKTQLLKVYNQVANRKFSTIDNCDGKARSKIITPKTYTNEQFNNLYNEDYFIKLYCMFRFIEEESKHSITEQDHIITDFLNLSRSQGTINVITAFERFVSQTFDNRGSLSYLIGEQEKREDV
mgnify:FL=1